MQSSVRNDWFWWRKYKINKTQPMAISAYATLGSFTLIVTLRQRSFGFLFSLFWFLCLELRSTVLFSSESFELIPKQILMLYIAVNQTGHSLTKIEVFLGFLTLFLNSLQIQFFFWIFDHWNQEIPMFFYSIKVLWYICWLHHTYRNPKNTPIMRYRLETILRKSFDLFYWCL